jgi:hypothetical protein
VRTKISSYFRKIQEAREPGELAHLQVRAEELQNQTRIKRELKKAERNKEPQKNI